MSQITLHKRQWEAFKKTREYPISGYMGGIRSGKTIVGNVWSKYNIYSRPNEVGGIFANTHNQLTKSTLKEFKGVLDASGIYENVHYLVNKNPEKFFNYRSRFADHNNVWSFCNGAQIIVFSLETQIRGIELGWVHGDEIQDATIDELMVVMGRMSGSEEPRTFYTFTPPAHNPDIDNMVYENDGSIKPNYTVGTTFDNKSLSKVYLESLNNYDEITFKREVLAQRVTLGVANFMYAFSRQKHVSEKAQYDENARVYVSIDFNNNPFVATLAHRGRHENGVRYIHYFDNVVLQLKDVIYDQQGEIITSTYIEALAKEIKRRTPKQASMNLYAVTGDANTGRMSTVMNRVGRRVWDVVIANFGGNDHLFELFNSNPSHKESRELCNSIFSNYPEVYIHPKCHELIRDLEFVKAKPDGSIIKNNRQDITQQSDLLDALRYDLHAWNYDFTGLIKRTV